MAAAAAAAYNTAGAHHHLPWLLLPEPERGTGWGGGGLQQGSLGNVVSGLLAPCKT